METKLDRSESQQALSNLSALYDGALSASDARALVRQSLADGGETLSTWRSYSAASSGLSAGETAEVISLPPRVNTPAANDSVFRWKIAAGVAAFAAAGSLVWNVLSFSAGDSGQTLAQVKPAAPAASTQEAVMLRDPRLDALMAAHRQFGGVSALQQGTGALHNVSLVAVRP